MWATWWVWIAGGFALGVLEVILPGFIFLGFAIGAVLTGILIGLGLMGGNLAVTILIFSLASLAAWFVLRRTMGVRDTQVKVWDRDINDGGGPQT